MARALLLSALCVALGRVAALRLASPEPAPSVATTISSTETSTETQTTTASHTSHPTPAITHSGTAAHTPSATVTPSPTATHGADTKWLAMAHAEEEAAAAFRRKAAEGVAALEAKIAEVQKVHDEKTTKWQGRHDEAVAAAQAEINAQNHNLKAKKAQLDHTAATMIAEANHKFTEEVKAAVEQAKKHEANAQKYIKTQELQNKITAELHGTGPKFADASLDEQLNTINVDDADAADAGRALRGGSEQSPAEAAEQQVLSAAE